jgi:hypothetical protein
MFDQERSYQAERLNLLRTQVAFAVEADTIATRRTRPGGEHKLPTVSHQALSSALSLGGPACGALQPSSFHLLPCRPALRDSSVPPTRFELVLQA